MIIFKVIFTLLALAGALLVWKRQQDGLLSWRSTLWWLLIWLALVWMVWYPSSTQTVADILGIGRGVDLIIYSALVFIFLTIFRLTVKIELLQRDITKVVRKNALDDKV